MSISNQFYGSVLNQSYYSIGITPGSINTSTDAWQLGYAADTTTTGSAYAPFHGLKKRKGKEIIKCSKCGKKIAEYWYDKRNEWEVASNEEILCEDCHLLEKLKE